MCVWAHTIVQHLFRPTNILNKKFSKKFGTKRTVF